ncbi:MAG: hypothetical protein JSS81_08600 [Acidobacteria bacterium]|nr:hypothetical protein [Acidobacteriota bacterium]
MKLIRFCALFVCLSFLTSAAVAGPLDLRVRGVGVGTSYKTLLKKLGRPAARRTGGTFPCDEEGVMMTLEYDGLTVKLIRGSKRRYFVAAMTVTGAGRTVSGARIGMRTAAVRKLFGREQSSDRTKESETLAYYIADGFARFVFRAGRLVRVEWELNLC